jgi:rhamnosyltransferase
MAPFATAVVPVKNGAEHLPALLAALRAQVLPGGLEILVIDDGSARLAREAGAAVLEIPAARFDHGETRNLGAREAHGEHVLFLSQDAIPAGTEFARKLIGPLVAEARVAGAFARQEPRPDADALTRRDFGNWVASSMDPRIAFVDDPVRFEALPPGDRHRLAAFDNVASAVRRATLLEHPFAPSRFGEDIEWGLRMLRGGRGLAYVPEAVVVHSHRRQARALFRRNYLGHRLLARLFELRTIPDLPQLVRAFASGVASDLRTLFHAGAAPSAWLAAPAQTLAAAYGQYRGGRDESLGRPYPEWA